MLQIIFNTVFCYNEFKGCRIHYFQTFHVTKMNVFVTKSISKVNPSVGLRPLTIIILRWGLTAR